MDGRFTDEELAIAKSVDLCAVAESLGYTVKRIGKYHTLKEMDSIRIYNRSHWYRWSRQFDKGNNGGSQIDFLRVFCGMSVTSILAASKGYQKAYTKWVQETEVEIEEPDDEEEERISYEEKTGVLGNDKSETIKKINFKKMDATTLETYVKAGKRLRYKGLTPKRNENIEIFITSQKNFKGIKVGIIDSQNRIRYIQDRGRDLVEHRFKIEKEGKYDVFIEMEDKKDVKIVGMINIDDD